MFFMVEKEIRLGTWVPQPTGPPSQRIGLISQGNIWTYSSMIMYGHMSVLLIT